MVNEPIDFDIHRYNAVLPYPKAVHLSIEAVGNIYQGKRFWDWSIKSYNSQTCADQGGIALETASCKITNGIASGGIAVVEGSPDDDYVYMGDVAYNSDGGVTITETDFKYAKMFHPKTRKTWHIAQAASDAFRRN
ncbi:hypothetical protein QBC36DRAFT_289564 [Triangularia setosa]|uniref:Uncharacterized protein n=1 Tax=Triangularia setosa TaxID=2587417 RepID=A0AAN7A9H5_9PEZI|nr:hypothetical protein QBC36DRAFT_289564 [Podospora setosa]